MEDLEINSIPVTLLARILLQLPTLPSQENIDLMNIMTAGLAKYGNTSDINAFLNYCKAQTHCSEPWLWEQYEINNDSDWDIANNKKQQELVGIRFLLTSETARNQVELTRFAKLFSYDPNCIHFYQGRPIPIDSLLNDTLAFFKKENVTHREPLEKLIELRLEKFARDKHMFERQSSELDHADYHLMGALMVRYDSTATRGYSPRSWCLYLRDYRENTDGSVWRILTDEIEQKVDSEQAVADIRGTPQPTEFSKDYRPVYLFYGNLDMLQPKGQDHVITFDDYTFDDEDENSQLLENTLEEEETCKHCGIKEIINDVNDMFFCENCNRGVHQLCEEPPIQPFEKDVDPWYCRNCCKLKNIPLPTFNPAKRKREDDDNNENLI